MSEAQSLSRRRFLQLAAQKTAETTLIAAGSIGMVAATPAEVSAAPEVLFPVPHIETWIHSEDEDLHYHAIRLTDPPYTFEPSNDYFFPEYAYKWNHTRYQRFIGEKFNDEIGNEIHMTVEGFIHPGYLKHQRLFEDTFFVPWITTETILVQDELKRRYSKQVGSLHYPVDREYMAENVTHDSVEGILGMYIMEGLSAFEWTRELQAGFSVEKPVSFQGTIISGTTDQLIFNVKGHTQPIYVHGQGIRHSLPDDVTLGSKLKISLPSHCIIQGEALGLGKILNQPDSVSLNLFSTIYHYTLTSPQEDFQAESQA